MANRFWVGGTATWDATAGTKWATTSGGAGGAAVPTAADDVFFDAASSAGTITTSGTATDVCRSLTCTGFTGTLNHAGGTVVSIGDGTAGASSVALLLVAGMTYTSGGRFDFLSTSGTVQTITSGGKTFANITINAVGGSYQCASNFNVGTSSTLTLTAGTLNTNGQTCSWGLFASNNSNTRALTLGASAITITGTGTPWDITTTTGMSFTPNTSAITLSGTTVTFAGGSLTYNNVSFTGAGTATIGGANTFNNLTRTGTAATSTAAVISANQIVNGVFTCNGNSSVNTTVFRTGSTGTQRSVTVNGSFSISNTIFVGIASAGTAGTWTGTILGDGGGNSGITFDTPRNVYWVAFSGGSAAATTSWSNSDGGASGAAPPLPQDTAKFTANSITSTGKVITMNMTNIGGMDFTGILNVPIANFATSITIYGSMTFVSSSLLTLNGTSTFTFRGSGSYTWSFAGQTMARDYTISPLGNPANYGTWTLGSNLLMTTADTLTLTTGTFNANNKNVTTSAFSSTNSNTRSFSMGSGTWTLSGVGTIWTTATSTGLTQDCGTSTILITDVSASNKGISSGTLGNANIFYNLTVTTGGAGLINFGTNDRSFNSLSQTGGTTFTVQFTAGTTTTITGASGTFFSGAAGNLGTIKSITPASAFTVSKSSGVVSSDYLSLTDSTATGGAVFYAGANSTNVSGNTGWIFTAPQSGNFLLMF